MPISEDPPGCLEEKAISNDLGCHHATSNLKWPYIPQTGERPRRFEPTVNFEIAVHTLVMTTLKSPGLPLRPLG